MPRRILVGPFPHYYAIVDNEDYDRLSEITWGLHNQRDRNTQYAVCSVGGQIETMHRLITGFIQTDHRNGIGLDNRRENLRQATHSQNKANCPKQLGDYSSEFKGVTWNRQANKWRVQISVNGKGKHLGYFTDEEEAARAYDRDARLSFGEFARCNFPL